MHKKSGEELNSVFAQSCRGCLCAREDVCACASDVCVCVCLCAHASDVCAENLYENVDSAKIKVPFYTTDIDILHVASIHRIVIHRIDISMNRYTPNNYVSCPVNAWPPSTGG